MKRAFLLSTSILFIVLLFFYPVLKGNIPFPGDLLAGSYFPYNTLSYGGYAQGAVPHKAQGIDVIRQSYPWKYFIIDSFKKLQVPLWNPYNLSGNPLMANFQSGIFYPLNVVFMIDFISGWTMYVILTSFLAMIFMYLFLRELKMDQLSSIFGSITFAFSSYMVFWVEWGNVGHTFLWLPFVLWCVEKLFTKIRIKYIVLGIFSLCMAILAGYIQGYFYMVMVVGIYFLGKMAFLRKKNRHYISLLLVFLFVPLALTLFQILPTVELFNNSTRNNYTVLQIQQMLNPLYYLITLFIPNFFGHPAARTYWFDGAYIERTAYIGLIPIMLCLYAFSQYKKRKEILIFGFIFFLSIFLSVDFFVNRFLYLLPIPVLSTTVPVRVVSLLVFSGSILSAYGFSFFIQEKKRKNILALFVSIAILFLGAWIFIFLSPQFIKSENWMLNISVAKRNIILPFLLFNLFGAMYIFFLWIEKKKLFKLDSNFFRIAIIFVTIFDLFYFFHRITPFSTKEFVYPRTEVVSKIQTVGGIDRVWGYGGAYMDTNIQTFESIFSTDGYEPLHIKRYGELLSSSKNGKIAEIIKRSDAALVGGYGTDDLRENVYRQRLLNLLGVKYITHKFDFAHHDDATFPTDSYKLLFQKENVQLYENKTVYPRFYFTSNYYVEKNPSKIISKIYDPSFDLRNTSILEEEILEKKTLSKDLNAKLNVVTYSPNEITLSTSSKTNMLLFTSDNYYPGWKVTIDNMRDKIYRANYSFRAVLLPKGDHTVSFRYEPDSFRNGILGSIVALILVSVALVIYKIKLKKHV